MIIGNRSRFAIEFEMNQQYGGVWLYGKICYWIAGQRIGDYDLGTSLRDVLYVIKNILRDNGNRAHEHLFSLEATELYKRINDALYDCEESSYADVAIRETWARFDVGLTIDVFDEWKVFLIENQEKARIIAKKIDQNFIFEEYFETGEFDVVVAKIYEELDKLYNDELGKS